MVTFGSISKWALFILLFVLAEHVKFDIENMIYDYFAVAICCLKKIHPENQHRIGFPYRSGHYPMDDWPKIPSGLSLASPLHRVGRDIVGNFHNFSTVHVVDTGCFFNGFEAMGYDNNGVVILRLA